MEASIAMSIGTDDPGARQRIAPPTVRGVGQSAMAATGSEQQEQGGQEGQGRKESAL